MCVAGKSGAPRAVCAEMLLGRALTVGDALIEILSRIGLERVAPDDARLWYRVEGGEDWELAGQSGLVMGIVRLRLLPRPPHSSSPLVK